MVYAKGTDSLDGHGSFASDSVSSLRPNEATAQYRCLKNIIHDSRSYSARQAKLYPLCTPFKKCVPTSTFTLIKMSWQWMVILI